MAAEPPPAKRPRLEAGPPTDLTSFAALLKYVKTASQLLPLAGAPFLPRVAAGSFVFVEAPVPPAPPQLGAVVPGAVAPPAPRPPRVPPARFLYVTGVRPAPAPYALPPLPGAEASGTPTLCTQLLHCIDFYAPTLDTATLTLPLTALAGGRPPREPDFLDLSSAFTRYAAALAAAPPGAIPAGLPPVPRLAQLDAAAWEAARVLREQADGRACYVLPPPRRASAEEGEGGAATEEAAPTQPQLWGSHPSHRVVLLLRSWLAQDALELAAGTGTLGAAAARLRDPRRWPPLVAPTPAAPTASSSSSSSDVTGTRFAQDIRPCLSGLFGGHAEEARGVYGDAGVSEAGLGLGPYREPDRVVGSYHFLLLHRRPRAGINEGGAGGSLAPLAATAEAAGSAGSAGGANNNSSEYQPDVTAWQALRRYLDDGIDLRTFRKAVLMQVDAEGGQAGAGGGAAAGVEEMTPAAASPLPYPCRRLFSPTQLFIIDLDVIATLKAAAKLAAAPLPPIPHAAAEAALASRRAAAAGTGASVPPDFNGVPAVARRAAIAMEAAAWIRRLLLPHSRVVAAVDATRRALAASGGGAPYTGGYYLDEQGDGSVVSCALSPSGMVWLDEAELRAAVGAASSLVEDRSGSNDAVPAPVMFPADLRSLLAVKATAPSLDVEAAKGRSAGALAGAAPATAAAMPSSAADPSKWQALSLQPAAAALLASYAGPRGGYTGPSPPSAVGLSEQLATAELRQADERRSSWWRRECPWPGARAHATAGVPWPVLTHECARVPLGGGAGSAGGAGAAAEAGAGATPAAAAAAAAAASASSTGAPPALPADWALWAPSAFPRRRGLAIARVYHGTSIELGGLIAAHGFRRAVCRYLPGTCETGACDCQMEGYGAYFADYDKAERPFARYKAAFDAAAGGEVAQVLAVDVDFGHLALARPHDCGCGCGRRYVDHLGLFYARGGCDSLFLRADSLPASRYIEWCVPDPRRATLAERITVVFKKEGGT